MQSRSSEQRDRGLDKYERPFPRVVRIEPAAACNLACSHCPTGTIVMARGLMKPDTFERVMDSLRTNRDAVKVVVLYHGGEPLLNKRFPDMLRQVKELGVPFVKTVTNGMVLTDAVLSGLIDHGLDWIEFSIDGNSPAENDFIRRNCDYETVVRNIKRLIDAKRMRGADKPAILINHTRSLDPETYTESQETDIPAFLREEFSGAYAGEVDFKARWAMRWPHMEVLEDIYDVFFDPYDREDKNYCDHIVNTLTVRSNGDVVACCYDLTSKLVLGNVLRDDLGAIWNNKLYRELRRSIDTKEYVSICADCNTVRPNVFLTLKPEVQTRLGEHRAGGPRVSRSILDRPDRRAS